MTKRHEDGSKCNACFMKGCDCDCETCIAARERNSELSQNVLDLLNVADAMTKVTVETEAENNE